VLLASLLLGLTQTTPSPPPAIVMHEWGTFTTVFSPSGRPVRWRPLLADDDLPSFVYDREGADTLPEDVRFTKSGVEALVRMETPVIYFYADNDEPIPLELEVRYTQGWLTEWFPHAGIRSSSGQDILRWEGAILPRAASDALPHDGTDSHYYAARDVAANLVADTQTGEVDRFLFYRGVGNAMPTVRASEAEDQIQAHSEHDRGLAVVFSSTGDGPCWNTFMLSVGTVDVPEPVCGLQELLEADLTSILVGQGLYEAEAAAMVATWRGHWFEAGTRVLSIVPRAQTEALLPLEMSVTPTETTRVMVERSELIRTADVHRLAGMARGGASAAELDAVFGRFADPILSIAVTLGELSLAEASALRAAL